jgi:hypothetical protein
MFTHLFTAESLIARVQQTISPQGNSAMAMNIAKIDVAESFLDIILMSGKCLNRIFEEKTPVHILDTVKKLTLKKTKHKKNTQNNRNNKQNKRQN